jgi:universal stress protein A
MKPTSPKPFCVLVAMDLSPESVRALERAMRIANAVPIAELHALAVIEPEPARWGHALSGDVPQQLGDIVTGAFAKMASSEAVRRLRRVSSRVRAGAPAAEVLRLAREIDADLIVVGSHERSVLGRWYAGSVANDVLRAADRPVLVHKARVARKRSASRRGEPGRSA